MHNNPSLRWRCRRGLKEMDILLQGFIEKYYDNLDSNEKKTFDELLEQADLDIMAWIMEKSVPPSDEIAYLVRLIRNSSSLPE